MVGLRSFVASKLSPLIHLYLGSTNRKSHT